MDIERAKKLKVGDVVNCPADRGDPAFTARVTFVGTQVCTHPCVSGEFIWVTVKRYDGTNSGVWSSNRLG